MVRSRLVLSVKVAICKIFLAGAGWQAAAFAADAMGLGQHRSLPFSSGFLWLTATGIGDALGVSPEEFWKEAGIVCTGSILSGSAWQGALDSCIAGDFQFEVGMLGTGFACGMLFWTGLKAGRSWTRSSTQGSWGDATLSWACGGASAFFVSTDRRSSSTIHFSIPSTSNSTVPHCDDILDNRCVPISTLSYHGNWLQAVTGERTGESGVDVLRAGLSTMLGFLVVQVLLIALVPTGFLWTENESNDEVEEVESVGDQHQSNNLYSAAQGRPGYGTEKNIFGSFIGSHQIPQNASFSSNISREGPTHQV
eukprot:jgi/Bigna1/66485/fgenesh1_pg.1_\